MPRCRQNHKNRCWESWEGWDRGQLLSVSDADRPHTRDVRPGPYRHCHLSRASTPDRTAFIMGKSKDDPFAVMEQDGFSLVHYGATVLAIPCNTAHYFYDRLAEALPVPVLNMPRLTVADAKAAGCTKLGILATDGTLAAETYQLACQAQGIDWAVPSEEHQQEVMSVIYDDIKQGKRADMAKFGAAVHDLKSRAATWPCWAAQS